MGECPECEWNVYQGHAPGCSHNQPTDPASAPWDRPDGCFGHCDPEGWHAPCRQPTDPEVER